MAFCLINKSNYFHNLSKIEEKVDKKKIAVVVKNNAYGHGLNEIANFANEYGILHAIVNSVAEAKVISNLFKSVIVLQDIPKEKIEKNIIITINSIDSVKKIPPNTKVELKVDTGMHRNGILIKDVDLAIDLIIKYNLCLNGVFTHFSSASIDNSSLLEQKKKFDQLKCDIIQNNKVKSHKIRFHCSASSSLFRVDNSDYDLVRVGLMSYGYVLLPEAYEKPELRPVLSLWGEKITSKWILKGESIGYGQSYTANRDLQISSYDVGYGDGFMRLNEIKTSTIENGQKILGVVSMNSFSTIGEDKEVCVFENAEKLSDVHGTIVYEIISNINPSIRRVIV